jgi:propanol-preferring alcohol dehydrogenase
MMSSRQQSGEGSMASMRAWSLQDRLPGTLTIPLALTERAMPTPTPAELLIRVSACGVCRTDLHLVEGDLPTRRSGVVPGHEVVGTVADVGATTEGFTVGDRVGVAWLRSTCGACRWCRAGRENLCLQSRYTGWDDDGGYAEYAVVPAAYAYRLPDAFDDLHAAPLLCAGIIGYRALRLAHVPPGGRLGIYGFGGSAHITAQIAIAQGTEVHVLTRGEPAQALARDLGAASVGGARDRAPVQLDAAILFAPAGGLVPLALEALDQGGTLAVAGIHVSDIPALNYQRHLFRERTLRSVTSNTRQDGVELLALAATLGVQVHPVPYGFDHAPQALADLRDGRFHGAAVLQVASD